MPFGLKAFSRSNGLFVTACVVMGGMARRVHNRLVRAALPGRPRIRVHPTAHLRGLRHCRIGDGFTAGRHLWLEAVEEQNGKLFQPSIRIGRDVIVNDDVHIAAVEEVTIGDDVLIASRVFISDHGHGRYGRGASSDPAVPPRLREVAGAGPVAIGDRVWIGEMVAVLSGVTIGDGSVIGAGSVVTRDIPAGCIAAGVPARVIKRYAAGERAWLPA